jgi:hypothetical protein
MRVLVPHRSAAYQTASAEIGTSNQLIIRDNAAPHLWAETITVMLLEPA